MNLIESIINVVENSSNHFNVDAHNGADYHEKTVRSKD